MSARLSTLHIRNFAIIEELEVNFEPGFSVFSGETGAGKSILFDALGLILGDRAAARVVRTDAARCDIAASFILEENTDIIQWLNEQNLLDEDEASELLIRRSIIANGQSKAYINSQPVKLWQLRDLGALLIDIHGQHAHQNLLKPAAQRHLLDRYGKHEASLQQLGKLYAEIQNTDQLLQRLNQASTDFEQRLQLLRYQLSELNELAPQEDEFEQLEQAFKRQSQAESLIQNAGAAHQQLYAGEGSLYDQTQSVYQQLQALQALDSGFDEAVTLCEQAQIQLKEAAVICEDIADSLHPDPQALAKLSQRLDQWQAQARKHRTGPEKLAEHWHDLQLELAELEAGDSNREQLQQQLQLQLEEYAALSLQLSQQRKSSAEKLQAAISKNLKPLGLPHAQCVVAVEHDTKAALSRHGQDKVELLISMNPGQAPGPLAKIASGGELARTSLAIQVVSLDQSSAPVLLFDEVDVGIGGGVAETVGRQLKSLAGNYQVFCVTHQAQVAALAHRHFRIAKHFEDGQTRTQVECLAGAARIDELARMLGGVTITEQTRAHAQEMLSLAD